MVIRSRQLQLYLFYFACGLMFLSVFLVVTKNTDNDNIKHIDEVQEENRIEQNEVNSTEPERLKPKFPQTLADLKQEALSSLSSCSCAPHSRVVG